METHDQLLDQAPPPGAADVASTKREVVVRLAHSPDEAQLFRTVGTIVDELYPDGREKLMAKLFANIALGRHSFVVSIGEQIVAYAAETPKPGGRLKLSTFWVREDSRRRGIGRLLIEYLVERWLAAGTAAVHVTVRAGREQELLGLLSEFGFTQVALVPDRYGRGRDEVVLLWTKESADRVAVLDSHLVTPTTIA